MKSMRIAQVVLPGASEYEKKCARVDALSLETHGHEPFASASTEAAASGADVAHVYAGVEVPADVAASIRIPFIATAPVARGRWTFRRIVEPRFVVSPVAGDGRTLVPEAVEDRWFEAPPAPRPEANRIGVFSHPAVVSMLDQVRHRLHRTREDLEWLILTTPPTPADLAGVDLWLDPAVEETDFDGFGAEALVAGVPVVAARTEMNTTRMEKGRTGFLVRPRDANEFTHAILTALFKPEVTAGRLLAARQTFARFRARQRFRVLSQLYQQTTT
jgi:hypothetical protein